MSSFSISALHSPFEAIITPVLDKSSSHYPLTTPKPPPTYPRGGLPPKPAKAYPPPRPCSSVYSSYHSSAKTHPVPGSWSDSSDDSEPESGLPVRPRQPKRAFTHYSLPSWDGYSDDDSLPAHPLPPHYRPQALLTTDHLRKPVCGVFGPPQEEMPGCWPKGPCRKSAPGWGINQGYLPVLITPDEWKEGEGGLRGYRYEGKGRGTMSELRPCEHDYWVLKELKARKKRSWWRRIGKGVGKVFCFR